MPWYVIALFVASQAVAIFYSLAAYRHLAERVDVFETFVLGAFARRWRFTEQGWRYRNRAIGISLLGFIVSVVLWWLSGTLE